MRKQRLSNVFVVIVFALATALPLVQQAIGILPPAEVRDNRFLAPSPSFEFRASAVVQFPRRFENWYADHMGLRGVLVSGYRWLTDAVLRSPDKVIIGRGDWLYLRRGVREDIETIPLLRDWCGRSTFTQTQLDRWVSAITANHAWLAKRGIDYLFVVPPNKITVIPEYLPRGLACRRGITRLQQLKDALMQQSGIELVDFRGVLRQAHESGEPIWYRTDTHWNMRGVTVAYSVLLDRILALQPTVRRIKSFVVSRQGTRYGDLELITYLDDLAPDLNWLVLPAEPLSRPAPIPFADQADRFGRRSSARLVDDPELPTAMVLHDSFFAGPMNRYLSESFSRTVSVFQRHPQVNRHLVEKVRPDIVIHEMVERSLLHPFSRRAN